MRFLSAAQLYLSILCFSPDDPSCPFQFDILDKINRNLDGYVGFARKPKVKIYNKKGDPVNFQHLFSVPNSQVRQELKNHVHLVLINGYYTINKYWRTEFWKNSITTNYH